MRPSTLALASSLLLSCLAATAPTECDAQETQDKTVQTYSSRYTGSFLALGVAGGLALNQAEDHSADNGWGGQVWVQATSPLQVLDVQLGYTRSEGASESHLGDLELTTHSVFTGIGLHPLFTLHLESSWWAYTLSSFHIFVGGEVSNTTIALPEQEVDHLEANYVLGAAIDAPLDDVNDGGSFWIGAQYRFAPLHRRELSDLDVYRQALFLRLSYRHNGLLVPVPSY